MDAIKEAEDVSRLHQVSGVPFMINDKIAIPGAQQPDVFLGAFSRQAIGS